MKVKIELTVAVDPQEWAETYGMSADCAVVRDDVRLWAAMAVSGQPDGLITIVSTRP